MLCLLVLLCVREKAQALKPLLLQKGKQDIGVGDVFMNAHSGL